ncbi:hypothetical protein D3C71_2035130 [compost metagenome]
MKSNLALLFALINQIERDVIHNKKAAKLPAQVIENGTRARVFAINDFKTYMKHVLNAEPNFDFTKYYEQSDYGKFVVSVDHDEVVGIKKLFRTLILS